MIKKGATFPLLKGTHLCRACGVRFSYRAKRRGGASQCPPCVKARRSGGGPGLLVATDARPGESVEGYLDRKDREAWNLGGRR